MNTIATLRRPASNCALQIGLQCFVEGLYGIAVGPDPFLRLDDGAVQQLRQHDHPIEQARPVLVGDPQRIAKTPGGDQQRGFALALEQRIGGHRGAHLHALDLRRSDGLRRAPDRAAGGCRPLPRHGTAQGCPTAACGSPACHRAAGRPRR
jgi:hypothetical protein